MSQLVWLQLARRVLTSIAADRIEVLGMHAGPREEEAAAAGGAAGGGDAGVHVQAADE
jgi:hypothetical protein